MGVSDCTQDMTALGLRTIHGASRAFPILTHTGITHSETVAASTLTNLPACSMQHAVAADRCRPLPPPFGNWMTS